MILPRSIAAVLLPLLAAPSGSRTSVTAGDASPRACVGRATSPALDHVVVAVRDLEAASARFTRRGFRVKPGRLHRNNLLNRHLKFRDGSSIELMTVHGEPGDAVARDYRELLTVGDGAVYVALGVRSLAPVAAAARSAQLDTRRSASGPWRFISFPATSPAAATFFSAGGAAVQDPDSLLSHHPPALGLQEAWLEAGPELGVLLESLGAKRCGSARLEEGHTGERYGLRRGSLVVVPPRRGLRPRVLGVVLRTPAPAGGVIRPFADFWIRYEPVGN